MSAIEDVPIRLLKHRVEVETRSNFSNSEQTHLNLWSPTKGGSTTHHIEFFTVGLANKRALLHKLRTSTYVNLLLTEEGMNYFPLVSEETVNGIVCVPMTFDWALWSYQKQLFKFKATFTEAQSVLDVLPGEGV